MIRLGAKSAGTFTALWPADEFYVPPVEVVAEESARVGAGHCHVIHPHPRLPASAHLDTIAA